MNLTDRQKKILRAVVDSYVATAEPVGSKAIAAQPDMPYSSATIRNELAYLTEQGLLEQPHTSAGRVPSPAGYRLYIDELMQDYRLSRDETQSLSQVMNDKLEEFDKAIAQVGQMISSLTNLPAYAVATKSQAITVQHYELIQTAPYSFILVLLLSTEAVHNKLIKLPVQVTEQELQVLSAVLNTSLTDLSCDEITPDLLARISRGAGAAASLVPVIVDFTLEQLRQLEHSEVYLTGQMRLLGQPEYKDAAKAQEVFETLDEEMLSNLPAKLPQDGPVQFLVGPENVAKELKDTSVVMMRFDIGEGMQGTIGVVGPTRMDYAKVTAKLSYFAENLGRMFQKGAQPPALAQGTEEET